MRIFRVLRVTVQKTLGNEAIFRFCIHELPKTIGNQCILDVFQVWLPFVLQKRMGTSVFLHFYLSVWCMFVIETLGNQCILAFFSVWCTFVRLRAGVLPKRLGTTVFLHCCDVFGPLHKGGRAGPCF